MGKNSAKYEQFGRLFGREVHMLESSKVDPNAKSKDEGVSIKVPAVLHTIKSIKVNTLKQTQLPGGVEAVVINGGDNAITIGLDEELIMKASDYNPAREKKGFFGEYAAANDLCNAANRAEVARLTRIIDDCKAQREALNNVIEANDRALAAYSDR